MSKKIILSVIFGAIISFCAANLSFAAEKNIAIVDVQSVVASSSLVKDLKKEQETQMKDLMTFIDKARKDVASVKDVNKKKSLEEKYAKEFQTKKDAIEKSYVEKLSEIDISISQKIEEAAKAGNYDIVISKNSILYGGTDITEDVKKLVK